MNRKPNKLEFLLTRLEHKHSGVRRCAATALGRLRDIRAVEPLLEHLRSDPSRWTREAAAVALGNIGDQRAVEPLVACLEQERDPEVCECIIETLGWIGDPLAIPALIHCLEHENWIVRWAAARALGTVGDARAIAPLRARLNDPAIAPEVASALKALGRRNLSLYENPSATKEKT